MAFPIGSGEVVWGLNIPTDPEPMLTTMGMSFAPGIPDVAIANALFDAFADNLMPLLTLVYSLQTCTVRYQADASNQIVVDSDRSGVAGETSGNPVTPNTAVLIQKRTGLAGRRNRGRMYVPGIREADVLDNGDIGVIQLGNWQTAAEAFLGALEAISGGPVIQQTAPIDTQVVSELVVSGKCATQRRRMRP